MIKGAWVIGAALAIPGTQDPIDPPPTDLHRSVEWVVAEATDLVYFEADFDGSLHVWVESADLDPGLIVELGGDHGPLEDDDSGGGTTAYLKVGVSSGQVVGMWVAAPETDEGSATLHWVAAPESEATRALAAAGRDKLLAIARLRQIGNQAAAREQLTALLADLDQAEVSAMSQVVSDVNLAAGFCGYEIAMVREVAPAWSRVHDFRTRVLPPEHPELMATKQRLAVALEATGDLHGSLKLKRDVHDACERSLPPNHQELLQAKFNLAASLNSVGDFSGALELEQQVHDVWSTSLPADSPTLLRAKANLAMTRRRIGDLAGALELEEYVHEAFERTLPADHPELLQIRSNLAVTRFTSGDVPGALELMEPVHAALESSLPAEHPDLLNVKMSLGEMRKASGDWKSALSLHELVLDAYERSLPPDHPKLLTARMNIATMRYDIGDSTGALELFEEVHSAQVRTFPPDHPELLKSKANLASMRSGAGDLEGALALEEEVWTTWRKSLPEDHPDLLTVQMNLAVTRKKLGDLEGALELERAVQKHRRRTLPPEHFDLLYVELNLTTTLTDLGHFDEALEIGERVRATFESLLPHHSSAVLRARGNVASTCRAMGNMERALELTVAQLEGQVALARELTREPPRVARGAAQRELGSLSGSICVSRLPDGATDPSRDRAIFETLEALRSVSGDSMHVALACLGDANLETMREGVRSARRALSEAALSMPTEAGEVAGWKTHLVDLARNRDRLQGELRAKLEESGLRLVPPTAEQVASALDEDAGLITYFRFLDQEKGIPALLSIIVTPDADVHIVELGPAEELERLVLQWRTLVGKPVDSGTGARGVGIADSPSDPAPDGSLDQVGRILRERLLDPCLRVLDLTEGKSIHVVLDDFLLTLPLDALPGKQRATVGEEVALRFEVSARRMVAPPEDVTGEGGLLAFGGIDYDAQPKAGVGSHSSSTRGAADRSLKPNQLGPLVGTSLEAEAIGDLYKKVFARPPELLSEESATRSAFIERAEHARFLHIATHGWFAPLDLGSMLDGDLGGATGGPAANLGQVEAAVTGWLPEALCGLAFAGANRGADGSGRVDGVLTAEELATVDLRQCELAVLSACETNVGVRRSGQGIQSLQTALHSAGVRSAITSLWKVDDAATRRLMGLFYSNLWEHGLETAHALWQAKMTLRDEGAPIRHWAAWVLTGE